MAKRKTYDWKKIKADYELGKTHAYIHKKYDIAYNTLSMKIKRDKWEIVNSENVALSNLKESCEQISEVVVNAETQEKKDAIIEEVQTILEDNILIQNNRKLLKAAQGIIGQEIKANKVNISNIKSVTSAIKDIENVANPTASQSSMQVNTNIQNNIVVGWE